MQSGNARHRKTRRPNRQGIVVRDLESSADLEQCVALQRETWGADCGELVPPAVITVARKIGGLGLGAFDARGALVGFVFGLTGLRHDTVVHWSHMLAVREDLQDRGIGRRLKEEQYRRLVRAGITSVFWTFDPLVARNAHFNLVRLGARVVEYVESMYGAHQATKTDSIIGSDRFIVEWSLPPLATAVGRRVDVPKGTPIIGVRRGATTAPLPDAAMVCVAIPADIQTLKQRDAGLARRWRHVTRRAFTHYLQRGYEVASFADTSGRSGGRYVLQRKRDADD